MPRWYVHCRVVASLDHRPVTLARGPFFVADARRAGLKWDDLQSDRWRRLSRGQYASSVLREDIRLRLRAASQRLPTSYAFSGATAAWLWGLDMEPCQPIEITIGRDVPVRARSGIRLRRASLPVVDVTTVHGFRVTSPLRTVCDLGSGRNLVEAVVAVDAAVRAAVIELSALTRYVATHSGYKGVKRLRRSVALADPRSESPMETRLRMELVIARLPRPRVQVALHRTPGEFVARADLYYPDRRLVIEYDGANHRERLTSDLRRQNALVNAGFHLLRFSAADLAVPRHVVEQVRQARARLPKVSDSPDFAA